MNELKEENKYLFCDLNLVQDPKVRAYFQEKRTRILQKKRHGQQHEQEDTLSFTSFGQYFNNLGGSGGNLPEY